LKRRKYIIIDTLSIDLDDYIWSVFMLQMS
jgi:hypothetical protein